MCEFICGVTFGEVEFGNMDLIALMTGECAGMKFRNVTGVSQPYSVRHMECDFT